MAFRLRRPPKLIAKHEAYPYQLDAVRAVQSLSYAAIFHEQGLGKTKIATDLILLWLGQDIVDTVFVVTKKMLVQNWVDELVEHTYVTPRVLSGNRRANSIALNSPVLVYILNYEVISTNLDLIRHFLCTCRVGAVLDESQKIKNPEARISKCVQSISSRFERRIIMTGTPAANRPYDIWSQINFLDWGKALGSTFQEFKAKLDLPKGSGPLADYSDTLAGVMNKIGKFSVRETKRTAGIHLPNKTILTHFVEMAPRQSTIYSSYRNKLAYELMGECGIVIDRAEDILKRLLRLVQCASNPTLLDKRYDEIPIKYTKLIQLFDEIQIDSHKAIIWSGFVDNVDWLSSRLSHLHPQRVHGRISVDERNHSIRRFKSDPKCRILLATPGAAKEGLTLTVANHVIFYDRGFSLDDYLQAQDRIHRISQRDECYVHNLIAKNTIDEWVDTLLNAKYQAAQLTQGDISRKQFDVSFNFNLTETLEQVLKSDNSQ